MFVVWVCWGVLCVIGGVVWYYEFVFMFFDFGLILFVSVKR